MSWSDDTRCLFCDGKLPLFRKLAQGQFCTKAHQEAYWKEQDQLAVEVLHRTHDALQSYKPAVPIESILGPMVTPAVPSKPLALAPQVQSFDAASTSIPELQGLQRQSGSNRPVPPPAPSIIAADPVEYEAQARASKPSSEVVSQPVGEFNTLAGAVPFGAVPASAPDHALVPAALTILDGQWNVCSPALTFDAVPAMAMRGLLALRGITPGRAADFDRSAHPLEFSIAPMRDLRPTLAPCGDVLEKVEQEAFPLCETLFVLAEPDSVNTSSSIRTSAEALEFPAALLEQPRALRGELTQPAVPVGETLFVLSGLQPISTSTPIRDASEEVEFPVLAVERPQSSDASLRRLTLTANTGLIALPGILAPRDTRTKVAGDAVSIEPRALAAKFESLRIESLASDPMSALLSPSAHAPLASLPMFEAQGAVESPANRPVSFQAFVPEGSVRLPDSVTRSVALPLLELRTHAEQVLRLDVAEKIQPTRGLRLRPGFVAAPVQGDAILPKAKLAPVPPRYCSGGVTLSDAAFFNGEAPSPLRVIAGATNFWNHAPRDLKMLLFAIPLALGLAFHPSLPKVSVQAPQTDTKKVTGQFQEVLNTQMASLRKSMAERAAVGLDENFRQGLDNWMGNSGSTAEWSFDQAGFVQPGRVALYQPSLGLADYEFQFLGAIDQGALSWVTRAVDFQNYYVVKLVVVKNGPVPQMGITRYAVVDGKPMDRVDTPVTFSARTDSLYRVSMVMQGDHYSLVIQGQMIDSWNEPRLKRGGVGFFTNRGERSRIGWVQITHQYDMLGRLFAYLAP